MTQDKLTRLARGFAAEWLRPNDPDHATEAIVDTLSTAMLAFHAVARGVESRACAEARVAVFDGELPPAPEAAVYHVGSLPSERCEQCEGPRPTLCNACAEARPSTEQGGEAMTERLKHLCACGNELFHEGNDYGACLVLLPDSLDRPMHKRISILLERANNEGRLAVALRQKLEEVAGPDVASSIV